MDQKKLPVELIAKIVSSVKGEPSLARTMGKYLSKKQKEQLTNFSNKNEVIKNCNLAQVKNLHLLGIKFTMDDLLVAAKNRCVDIVKFLQEVSPDCLIKRQNLYGPHDLNTLKSLLDSVKRKQFDKSDFLNLIGMYIFFIITKETRYNKDFVFYLIKEIPYKYELKDFFGDTFLGLHMRDFPTPQRKDEIKEIIKILEKSDLKLTKDNIDWLNNL